MVSDVGAAQTQSGGAGPNLLNLMGMAGTAERAGNNEEAIAYYNRVLEADPTFSQAWLGKGRAAGWLSTLQNLRIGETLVAFGHALATAGEDQALVTAQAAGDLTTVCSGVYGMAQRHNATHGAVPGVRGIYVTTAATVSDAVDQALIWQPDHRGALDLKVLIARQLLDLGVTPEFAAILRQRMDEANTAIEALDPTYQRPGLAALTQAQQEQNKAELDNLGYIVLFIVAVVCAIVTAATRH